MSETCELLLSGCGPEPLMRYLKALGILRLVSEQADRDATACWRNDQFVLRSELNDQDLVHFFLKEYKPTPIVVPWSGNDFFTVRQLTSHPKYKTTPTGSAIIEAFLESSSTRLAGYRAAIDDALAALERAGIKTKSDMAKAKPRYLSALRSGASDELVGWIDSAALTLETSTLFSALLGSGGGSDGNTHFSDNFMQNLWEMLPDFDEQRVAKKSNSEENTPAISAQLCRHALFGTSTDSLVVKRTSALYDSGAVGGPNATQGMNRESLSNPWNIILLLEGTLAFAGGFVRRNSAALSVAKDQGAAFPFQFRYSFTIGNNTVESERSGREIWLPIWSRQVTWDEASLLLREGRAEIAQRVPRYGVEMARAAASLGIDRGIHAFYRYIVVKGRVGGDNYNTAASLGRFDVTVRHNIGLFEQLDWWLLSFRRACSTKESPQRYKGALSEIDTTIFDYCRFGDRKHIQAVLVALGRAERELAVTGGQRGGKDICPTFRSLSSQWLKATHDGSSEYAIALALAGIHDAERKIEPLRANLEPVSLERNQWTWKPSHPHVAWSGADLAGNLASVLERRILDGARAGCEKLPLDFRRGVSLKTISLFIEGALDDRRIDELVWGLILIDHRQQYPSGLPRETIDHALPLPREYALLKLLFLPRPLVRQWDDEHKHWNWRLAQMRKTSDGKDTLEEGLAIRPEPRVLPLLRAGRVNDACRIAYQRLRASGLIPLPASTTSGVWRQADWESGPSVKPQRLAAALLLPVGDGVVNRLIHLVTRQDSEGETVSEPLMTEGASHS